MDDDFTVYFPLQIQQVLIEKTIDLRLEHVREWFASQVFTGLPTACYVYGRNIKDASNMRDVLDFAKRELYLDSDEIQGVTSLGTNAVAEVEKIAAGRVAFLLYGSHPEGVGNKLVCKEKAFFSMLPLLMFHPRGGSPVTEAIGCWLREIGANALVFPSARSNTQLDIEKGRIKHIRGWCLLDYRGAPIPPKTLRIIKDPVSYIDMLKPFRFSVPDSTKESCRGTFQVRGIEEREQIDWIYGQELFWQVQHFSQRAELQEKQLRGPGEVQHSDVVISLAELRAAIKAGATTVDDLLESASPPRTMKTAGQWLAAYLNKQIPNETLSDADLEYGPEWFMYRLDPYYEPQIICPICEYGRIWSIDRDPVDEKCPSCEYERPQKSSPDEIRERYRRLCSGS